MRELKFDLIYKGETGFHHKKYYIDELMTGINRICDIHNIMVLIAKRQYTGLKDKNGKEIYEGDVISFSWKEQEEKDVIGHFRSPVVFERGSFVFRFASNVLNFSRMNNDGSILWKDYFSVMSDVYYEIFNIEAIGNIYENPELINWRKL